MACIRPHSLGPSVSNWSPSLHAINLTSPTFMACTSPQLIFTSTHNLVPTFSQSKAPGYVDIRCPSPWNYVHNTAYAPTSKLPYPRFAEKDNTLFWRGADSEGVSIGGGAWKCTLRQRLVPSRTMRQTRRQSRCHPAKDGSSTN